MERESEHLYATIVDTKESSILKDLSSSISSIYPNADLHVLLLGASGRQIRKLSKDTKAATFYSPNAIVPFYKYLILKLRLLFSSSRAIKGVFKPYFLLSLIQKQRKGVILIDPDLKIKEPISEMVNLLSVYDAVLFPNRFPMNPKISEEGFIKNFKRGFYTSSLIGFSKNAESVLKWWAMVCSYRCKDDKKRSLYYEQSYLNFIPVIFDKVKVMSSKFHVITDDNSDYLVSDDKNEVVAESTLI